MGDYQIACILWRHMGKLNQVNRNVSMTLDKLPGIRGELVRTNHSWESWNFLKLCEARRQGKRRNPLDSFEKNYVPRRQETSNKLFNAQQREPKQRGCVYCDDTSHVPLECPKISTVVTGGNFWHNIASVLTVHVAVMKPQIATADLHAVNANADIILIFVTERGHSKN